MKTVNSYVRIYQEKIKKTKNQKEKIEKEKEKEKEKEEEDLKKNNSFLKKNQQENIAEIRGNGVNFDILPDWEGAKDINEIEIKNDFPLSKSLNIKNLNKNNENYKNFSYDFNNINYNNNEILPNKENKEYLLYNKFSQKPIMKLPNPYIKNSFQGIPDDKIETNETENDNNNFNRDENIKSNLINKEYSNKIKINNDNYNQKFNQRNNENYKTNNNKNNFGKESTNFNKINKEENNTNYNNNNGEYNYNEDENNENEYNDNENNNNNNNNYEIENENNEKEEINNNDNYNNNNDNYNNNNNNNNEIDNNNNNNNKINNNEIYNYENKNKSQNKNYEIKNDEEKEKRKKFLPKNLNDSDIITCSLSDDSLNVTHEQMNILNKEANQLYNKLNHKLSNRIFNLQHPYLERDNKNNYYQEKKKLLEPLINKQKELLQQNLRKNKLKRLLNQSTSKSIDTINNSYSQRNMRSQIQNYKNMNNINMNNMNLNNMNNINSMSINFPIPQIQYNNMNSYNNLNNNIIQSQLSQNLPLINNNYNNINNNNSLTKIKKINYKPHTLKEYKENLKKQNYRYPTSLGSNIGSPEWEEEHKKLEKKFEYCKSVQKIEKDIKPKKINQKTKLNKTEINKEKDDLFESKNKEINKYNIIYTEETPNKFKNNRKLPPIPIFSHKKKIKNNNNDNNNNNNDELNKIISQNKELGALLLSHDLYNSEVEKIKQSL